MSALETADTMPAPPMPPKVCSCGRVHDAASWASLHYLGVMRDSVVALELRNCPCGSTISVELDS